MNVIWSSNWCDAFILLNSDDLIIITNITREKFEPLLEKFVLSLLSRIKIIDNEARHCQETQHITALCEIESSAEIELSLLHLLKRHKLRRPSQTTETVKVSPLKFFPSISLEQINVQLPSRIRTLGEIHRGVPQLVAWNAIKFRVDVGKTLAAGRTRSRSRSSPTNKTVDTAGMRPPKHQSFLKPGSRIFRGIIRAR